jgi:hypothetical protein
LQDDKKPDNSANNQPNLSDIENAPEVIPASKEDVPVSIQEYAEKLARTGLELDQLRSQVDAERAQAITNLIRPSAEQAFKFMWCYCGGVFALLLLDGFCLFGFNLPESTVDYLVGSTAVTVLGLVGMVLTGVFLGTKK